MEKGYVTGFECNGFYQCVTSGQAEVFIERPQGASIRPLMCHSKNCPIKNCEYIEPNYGEHGNQIPDIRFLRKN